VDVEADEDVEVVVDEVDGVVVEVVAEVVVDVVVVVEVVVVSMISTYFNIKPRLVTELSEENPIVKVLPVAKKLYKEPCGKASTQPLYSPVPPATLT